MLHRSLFGVTRELWGQRQEAVWAGRAPSPRGAVSHRAAVGRKAGSAGVHAAWTANPNSHAAVLAGFGWSKDLQAGVIPVTISGPTPLAKLLRETEMWGTRSAHPLFTLSDGEPLCGWSNADLHLPLHPENAVGLHQGNQKLDELRGEKGKSCYGVRGPWISMDRSSCRTSRSLCSQQNQRWAQGHAAER